MKRHFPVKTSQLHIISRLLQTSLDFRLSFTSLCLNANLCLNDVSTSLIVTLANMMSQETFPSIVCLQSSLSNKYLWCIEISCFLIWIGGFLIIRAITQMATRFHRNNTAKLNRRKLKFDGKANLNKLEGAFQRESDRRSSNFPMTPLKHDSM